MALQANASEEEQPLSPGRQPHIIRQVELPLSIHRIVCGIACDFCGNQIDLDVAVIALDTYSFEMGAACYNQTSILNGSIIHSGDDKAGIGEGVDEEIKINLSILPQNCKSLWFIINARSGNNFTEVESIRFTLHDDTDRSKILYSYSISLAVDSTALLLGVLYCNDPYSINKQWTFKLIEERGSGHNFVESKYLMIDKLRILYDDIILMQRPKDRNKKYELFKGDTYTIDPEIKYVNIGLGWNVEDGRIDVDASVIIFHEDKQNKTFTKTDIVYWENKDYANAVIYDKKNVRGTKIEGEDDDLQLIKVDFNELNERKEADVLCVMINVLNGRDSFKSIRNCFVRLVDDRNNELCRFNLRDKYDTNGLIMCHIEKRDNQCWIMIIDGIGCKGNTAYTSLHDVMRTLRSGYKHNYDINDSIHCDVEIGDEERDRLMMNNNSSSTKPQSTSQNRLQKKIAISMLILMCLIMIIIVIIYLATQYSR